jgi:hypothetical protein
LHFSELKNTRNNPEVQKNKVDEEYRVRVYTVVEDSDSAKANGELGIPLILPRTRSTDGDPGAPGS